MPTMVTAMTTAASSQPAAIQRPPKTSQSTFNSSDISNSEPSRAAADMESANLVYKAQCAACNPQRVPGRPNRSTCRRPLLEPTQNLSVGVHCGGRTAADGRVQI